MRRTKIIATLGPASSSDAVLRELIATGVDVVRLNFSHGSHDSHADLYERVRREARRASRMVGVLQDLSGPKIRTGRLAGGAAVPLSPGQDIRIAVGDQAGDATRIFTTYADLPRAVHAGDRLLIDDGRIELKVARTDADEIVATVVDGGMLGERKGLNIPGVALSLESLTEKDADDLRFGLRLGVDLVAMSFVRRADDLRTVRDLLRREGREDVPLIAKLERPEAVARLEEILDVSDAVMVARGDLGLEMPLETVPRVQKEITRAARARGVPVIVATQVFESMRTEPRPTRAEVSDAANAVDDGVDAIMLAGETAVGLFPVRAVKTLDAVIREAEAVRVPAVPSAFPPADEQHEQPLCESAVTLARRSGADAIIAVTRTGNTARQLARFRSEVPVFAVTDRDDVAHRLTLLRGVVPLVVPSVSDAEEAYLSVARQLRSERRVPDGATLVFVNVATDLTKPAANFVRLMRLPEPL